MQATDRMYYMDPVATPTLELPDDAKIYAFEDYRSGITAQSFEPGIISVTGISFDNCGRAWFIGADENWYDGALINATHGLVRMNAIGWYDDSDLTIFGRRAVGLVENYAIFTGNRRSDQRRYGNGNDIDVMKVQHAVRAAPWAASLFPYSGDAPEVVEAKVAQAKLRWEQRRKHAFIIREGMQRGWLTYLKEDGIHEEHGMPVPRWDLYVEGTIQVETGTIRQVPRDEALSHLGRLQRDRLNALAGPRPAAHLPVRETVSAGIRTTVAVAQEYDDRQAINSANELVTERLRERIDNYGAQFNAITVRPILSSLV